MPDVKDLDADATMMCRMTYEWQGRFMQYNLPPNVDVSLSWTGVEGTMVNTVADPAMFSGTVETNMTIGDIRPSTISSHSCTITFNFSPGMSHMSQYAVNPVSHTCQPTPVPCKCDFTQM